MDATILTSRPPVRAKWTRQGTQALVPIVGDHTRHVLYGTMRVRGGLLIHDTPAGHQEALQRHLHMIRSLWRGWHMILFLDRASSHTADASLWLADELGIALRWLPVACPQLNPMDHLWRPIKGDIVANMPYPSLDESVTQIHQYLQAIGPAGWMRKAGVCSEQFWLKEYCTPL